MAAPETACHWRGVMARGWPRGTDERPLGRSLPRTTLEASATVKTSISTHAQILNGHMTSVLLRRYR
jgi:hypothetical protein